MRHKFRQASLLPYRRIYLAWASICAAQKGKRIKNVHHSDCSCGVVSTRRRRLGVFALAQLGKLADEKVARRSGRIATRFSKIRKGQACNPMTKTEVNAFQKVLENR